MLGSSQNKDIKEPQHRDVLWLVFVGYKECHTDGMFFAKTMDQQIADGLHPGDDSYRQFLF